MKYSLGYPKTRTSSPVVFNAKLYIVKHTEKANNKIANIVKGCIDMKVNTN